MKDDNFQKKKKEALVIHDSINYTEMINQQKNDKY